MSNQNKELIKLNIHPLLKVIENSISFFISSKIMMAMPSFQKAVVENHSGEMSQIETSVKFNGYNNIIFDIRYIFNEFNKQFNVSEKKGKIKAGFSNAFISHGRLMSISIFNILESSIYNKKINKTKEFRFVKHLRNGSAHGNKFNFDGKIIEDVKWRGKIIKQDEEAKQVFGKFIQLADLLVLVSDISDELDKFDRRMILREKIKNN